jgi:hypothetical protein
VTGQGKREKKLHARPPAEVEATGRNNKKMARTDAAERQQADKKK